MTKEKTMKKCKECKEIKLCGKKTGECLDCLDWKMDGLRIWKKK